MPEKARHWIGGVSALLEPNSIDTPVVQQEAFAPVLCFETSADEADALARANATEFGLAAAVFTADRSRAHRVAQGLKAGTVWTNPWGIVDDVFEEGGFKQSGIGRASTSATLTHRWVGVGRGLNCSGWRVVFG